MNGPEDTPPQPNVDPVRQGAAAAQNLFPEFTNSGNVYDPSEPLIEQQYSESNEVKIRDDQIASLEAEKAKLQKDNADLRQDVEAVEELSEYDAKTGLLNPVAFKERVEAVTRFNPERRQSDISADEKPRSHALLMLDIDDFKAINTALHHDVADEEVLLPLAEILKKVRVGDFAGRFGGEEFLVFLSDVDPLTALGLASRLQHSINSIRLSQTVGGKDTVGISMGLVDFPEGADYKTVLGRANERLLTAKQAGKEKNLIMTDMPGMQPQVAV